MTVLKLAILLLAISQIILSLLLMRQHWIMSYAEAVGAGVGFGWVALFYLWLFNFILLMIMFLLYLIVNYKRRGTA